MAKFEERNRAISLRLEGMSYNQIRKEIPISKSTLSLWLAKYPLSKEHIQELKSRDRSIERTRETKALKKENHLKQVRDQMALSIGTPSERERFLAGIFLYWAEGTKASQGVVCMTNTDSTMLLFFMKWLEDQGISRNRFRIRLHLYADMDISLETTYWSEILNLPQGSFRKPYVKDTFQDKRKNYKGRFGHGTCNLMVYDTTLYEKVMMGIEYIRDMYGSGGVPEAGRV